MSAMDPERWQRVEALFLEALEKDSSARAAFLDARCGGDLELRREVERLLAGDEQATNQVAAVVGSAVRSFHHAFSRGKRIGPYEILGPLGEGGMGAVYHARRNDEVFQKDVAIKVVKRGMDSAAILRRFQRERRILARLEHPSIARVLDGGSTEDGLPYLVMEYVEGRNLLDYAGEQRLDLAARLRLFSQVCEAVEYAHQKQIVHRDLKPNNILVDAHNRPRLLDFGIAKLADTDEPGSPEDAITITAGGLGILTPRYASPEQVKGERVTPASDVYSLGVILFELLTGRGAHRVASDSPAAIVKAVCEDDILAPSRVAQAACESGSKVPVPPAQLQGDLDRIILTALEKDPRQRYGSVRALAQDIGSYLASLSIATTRPTTGFARAAAQRWKPAAVASLLMLTLALTVYFLLPRARPAASTPTGKIMLAVLPLENLTGSDEQQFFIDGLHEEIISRLGRLRPDRLGVIARTSVLQYKETAKPVSAIGAELGAHYILEGSVRQAGERVRVTAQFIQVSDQSHLWVQTFDRAIGDLLSVQAEIGAHVADSLEVEVLPKALAASEGHSQLSREAYAAYLRGRYFWNRRWVDYPANIQRAVDQFQTVVNTTPSYAEGHSWLGQSYFYLSVFPGPVAEQQALVEKARSALSRALELDEQLTSARSALAWIRFRNDWDWAGAERELRAVLQKEPNSADIRQQLATLFAYTGRHREADHEIRLALELDPLSHTLHVIAFYVHLSGRRWEEARLTVRKLGELAPLGSTHVYLTSVLYALTGNCRAALDELAKLKEVAVEPEGRLGEEHNASYVLGSCGKPVEARRIAKALEERPHYLAQRLAVIYAGLGDRATALHWLEESFRRHEDLFTSVPTDPRLASLHNEPRFRTLLQKIPLPATN